MPNDSEQRRQRAEPVSAGMEELHKQLEELRRDRVEAQLVIDQQKGQVHQLLGKEAELRERIETLTAELKAQKRLVRTARSACNRKGRCFNVPGQPKPVLNTAQKIARETRRIACRLGFLGEEQTRPAAKKPTSKKTLPPRSETERYQNWIDENEPSRAAREELRLPASNFARTPPLSLVVPVFQPPPIFWAEFVDSVEQQVYDHWELCLAVVTADLDPTAWDDLQKWREKDSRIKLIELPTNRGIAENTNAALQAASGEYITFADQDDKLSPLAFYRLAEAINQQNGPDILYSDEDRLSLSGQRHSPFFKPEWSPELLVSSMYLGHLTCYRRDFLAEKVGFLRSEFDLSQDYDLALRATEVAESIFHVPHVLYHWREHPASGSTGGKPEARRSNLAALQDAMRRRGLATEVIEYPRANRARFRPGVWPKVSIIIPTDSLRRAEAAATQLPGHTSYKDFEVLIVTNGGVVERLRSSDQDPRVRFVLFNKPFNFSEKCNLGAAQASGERLIFLNDDVTATDLNWIEELIEPLENPEIGAVSPKLLYENGQIQHAGLVMGVRTLAGTAFHQQPANTSMHYNLAQSMRNVAALSAACLAVRCGDFMKIGGFDAVHTPIAHSDIDLCFKLREAGLRCVYTPFTTLQHSGHVSISFAEKEMPRQAPDKASIFLLQRWAGFATHDPFFTDSMRHWSYSDSPTPIRMSGRNNPAARTDTLNLLFASHELSLSGAPMMLLNAARWCQANGYFAVIMSPKDGPLRKQIEEAGIPIIIDPLLETGHESAVRFAAPFDVVIANTVFSGPLVIALHGAGPRLLWWMHETQAGAHFLAKEARLRNAVSMADMVLAPSEASATIYRPHTHGPVRVIRNGAADLGFHRQQERRPGEPLHVLLLGSLEPRKGQDILLDAIQLLPEKMRDQFIFTIAGRVADLRFAAAISARASTLPQVRMPGSLSHEAALAEIRASDIILVASRDEAMPTVTMLEAMSLGRAILSTTVGGALEFLRHDENALLIASESAGMLADGLERLARDRDLRGRLAQAARATFEEKYRLERFGAEFLDLLRELTKNEAVQTGRAVPAG